MSDTTAIAITRRTGLELVDPKLRTQYDQMIAEIATRLSPDHAFIFSRPEQSLGGDSDQTAWFVDGVGEPVRLQSIPLEQQDPIERRLSQIEGDIRKLVEELKSAGSASADLGRLIEKALERPPGEAVWVVDGRPVLVNWGLRVAGDRAPHQVASGLVTVAGPAATAATVNAAVPPSGERPGGIGPPPPPRSAVRSRSVAAPLLWLLFTVLLLICGVLLLRACAFTVPAWAPFLHTLLPNGCRVDEVGAQLDMRFELSRIQSEIEADQRALVLKAANCPVSCPILPQPERRTEVAPPPPAPPPREEVCSPVDLPSTANRGELELDLKWAGSTDLDLWLVCPDGTQVSYNAKNGCGATFDFDVNASSSVSPSPVEHIIWTHLAQAPAGRYTAMVTPYARKGPNVPRVPFDVYLTYRGRVIEQRSGVATRFGSGEKIRMFTFDLPLAERPSETAAVTEGRTPSGQACRIGGAGGASTDGALAPTPGPKP
ncbi:hypothetical protein [Methylorubrum extorquens]|uniref:Uncharacterized protein n=1 Tax=Methylorubrum extorquens (strain CM4 / NCIMB 13688) TaxID=440085 RepID=B7KW03_METC4|nr:hypothetical protein [Methylorubrum extorquens]ACK82819.1 hypothetical protein Mchl_1965 [Methylorubrum extorquens CM4]